MFFYSVDSLASNKSASLLDAQLVSFSSACLRLTLKDSSVCIHVFTSHYISQFSSPTYTAQIHNI